MPAGKRPIGEQLYLFSTNNGNQTGPECVIDAHGEQKLLGNGFTLPPGIRVAFYVPRGASLISHAGTATFPNPNDNYAYSSALDAIATGVAIEEESAGPGGICEDYNLTKLQKSDWALTNHLHERNSVDYASLVKYLDNHHGAKDIVTIRHRSKSFANITLSEVIQELAQNGYGYAVYHCCFCRDKHPFGFRQPKLPPAHVKGSSRPGGGVY